MPDPLGLEPGPHPAGATSGTMSPGHSQAYAARAQRASNSPTAASQLAIAGPERTRQSSIASANCNDQSRTAAIGVKNWFCRQLSKWSSRASFAIRREAGAPDVSSADRSLHSAGVSNGSCSSRASRAERMTRSCVR